MFGLDITVVAIIALAAIAAGAVGYGILFSRIETEKKTESRVNRVKSAETDQSKVKAARDRMQEMSKRRKSVQDSLKDLENKQQEKNRKASPSLKAKLSQAGLRITLAQFYMISGFIGFFAMLVAFLAGAPLLVCGGVFFIMAAGFPRWLVNFLVKRRMNKFLEEFPNSLDVMVRSIKSGLPLNDALRLIAADGWRPPVMTCSALRGEGMAQIWDVVERHRTESVAAGRFEARRRSQAIALMHGLVREGLEGAFRARPAVAEALPALEADVTAGRTTPFAAARTLLSFR